MIFCNGIKVGYKAWRNPPTYLQCFKKSRSSFNLCTRVTQGYVRKWYLSNTKPNFQLAKATCNKMHFGTFQFYKYCIRNI